METHAPPVEALHTNHQWFTGLKPARDRAQPWVRIFRLYPGTVGGPICGDLTVEDLDAAKSSDALSYCCGPPVLSCSISVNGTPGFRITRNLWNALQRVRKADSDRRIWVDAVCIDQDDEREKSSQVRHMHAVYSRAGEVCVYFGECREQAYYNSEDAAVRAADTFLRTAHLSMECTEQSDHKSVAGHIYIIMETQRQHWGQLWARKSLRAAQELQRVVDNSYGSPDATRLIRRWLKGRTSDVYQIDAHEFAKALEEDLLRDLACDASLHRLWWKRLWTVQELLLAKHPVVYCGPYVMPWTTMFKVWTYKRTLRKDDSRYRVSHDMSPMRLEIEYLDMLCCQPNRNLHALLLATTDKAVTEPKDRIFALLGALPQRTLSLDYSLDKRVRDALTVMHCIATQGTFDILFSRWDRSYQLDCGPGRLYSCIPNLDQIHGSCGVGWRIPCILHPEQGRWENARVNAFPAMLRPDYASRPQEFVLTGNNVDMNVIENTATRCRVAFNGACVTTVRKMYRLGKHDLDWILADLSASQYFAESLCDRSRRRWKASTTKDHQQSAHELYTLLLESCSLHGGRYAELATKPKLEAAQRDRNNDQTMRARVLDPEECPKPLAIVDGCLRVTSHPGGPEACHVLQALVSAVLEHNSWSGTFFITNDGKLGIGPESTQSGDQIVVLDGARSPFILRALENDSDYALLGDAFILGLMRGELRDSRGRRNLHFRKIVLQ
jgi:hypothetical protein